MKCLNCLKPVPQAEGKRERRYCSSKCKSEYHRKKNAPEGIKRKRGRPKKSGLQKKSPSTSDTQAPVVTKMFQPMADFGRIKTEYILQRRDMENEDQYRAWVNTVTTDARLTKSQINEILKAPLI